MSCPKMTHLDLDWAIIEAHVLLSFLYILFLRLTIDLALPHISGTSKLRNPARGKNLSTTDKLDC